MNSNCSNILDPRNLQEQVKKAFCHQELFWPFTVWTNCSRDLKIFANSRPSASNFKSFSRLLEQFFLTVGQINFGNKIPVFSDCLPDVSLSQKYVGSDEWVSSRHFLCRFISYLTSNCWNSLMLNSKYDKRETCDQDLPSKWSYLKIIFSADVYFSQK